MSKSTRKEKWKNVSITPQNVDEYLTDLYNDTKAQYINQGVSFNKDDPYQMGLLRLALLEPQSFSGLCKQLMANYFANRQQMQPVSVQPVYIQPQEKQTIAPSSPEPIMVNESENKKTSQEDGGKGQDQEYQSPTPTTNTTNPTSPSRARQRRSGGLGSLLTPQ